MWNGLIKFVVSEKDNEEINVAKLEELLSECDIDYVTRSETNILHFAALGHSSTMCSYILDICSDDMINQQNNRGETPLHWACINGNLDIVRLLLEAGADPTMVDDEDNSILHFAVETSNLTVAYFILENNYCSPMACNIDDITPLDIAIDNEDICMQNILQSFKPGSSGVPVNQFLSLTNVPTCKDTRIINIC